MTQLSIFLNVILIAGLFTVGTIVYKILKHVGTCVYWATRDCALILLNLREDVTKRQVVKGITKQYLRTLISTHRLRMSGAERTS